jgi:hypothetical protein
MNKLKECKTCINVGGYRDCFNRNDHEEFFSVYCRTGCKLKLVPNHIPNEQVIKYLKKIFKGYL